MAVKLLIAGLAAALPLSASAAPPCDGFDQAVEDSLKEVAALIADGALDNSAPRATMRELRIGNELTLIQIHLELAGRNGCPKRITPINRAKYFAAAVHCLAQPTTEQKDPQACKRETWKPGLQ